MIESSDSSLSVLLLEQVYGCLFYMKSRNCQGDGLVNQDVDRSHGGLDSDSGKSAQGSEVTRDFRWSDRCEWQFHSQEPLPRNVTPWVKGHDFPLFKRMRQFSDVEGTVRLTLAPWFSTSNFHVQS